MLSHGNLLNFVMHLGQLLDADDVVSQFAPFTFDASVAERVSASDVVRQAAAIVGGGGGGRPTMARAGGKDPEKLPEALAEAERLIVAAL